MQDSFVGYCLRKPEVYENSAKEAVDNLSAYALQNPSSFLSSFTVPSTPNGIVGPFKWFSINKQSIIIPRKRHKFKF